MNPTSKPSYRLTYFIMGGMVVGCLLGFGVRQLATPSFTQHFAANISLLTDVFLRLVQMLIAPLVFCTLVVGVAKLGNISTVGRVGIKAMVWFVSASLVSLVIGMVVVNYFKPGLSLNLSYATNSADEIIGHTKEFSLKNFVTHVIPKSLIEAMATNEILQIVVFSIFFGIATTSLGPAASTVIHALEALSKIILKMVGYVMNFAPIGVLGSMASIIAVQGFGIFAFYGMYLLEFLVAIILLWIVLLSVGFIILNKSVFGLLKAISTSILIAFTTTSSEAVFPKLTEQLQRFGYKPSIVSFILPLGYSFNLDGSMINMTFASIAIAQAYGIHLDWGTQLTMLLVLMLTSKGVAGVPRASLLIVAAVSVMFKIPAAGIALILPIDHFSDMLRSATNVVGNALATGAVSKWENHPTSPSTDSPNNPTQV